MNLAKLHPTSAAGGKKHPGLGGTPSCRCPSELSDHSPPRSPRFPSPPGVPTLPPRRGGRGRCFWKVSCCELTILPPHGDRFWFDQLGHPQTHHWDGDDVRDGERTWTSISCGSGGVERGKRVVLGSSLGKGVGRQPLGAGDELCLGTLSVRYVWALSPRGHAREVGSQMLMVRRELGARERSAASEGRRRSMSLQ